MKNKLKIMIITQDDKFVIPENILILAKADFLDLSEIVIVKSSKTLSSKKLLFLFGFGLQQCIKLQINFFTKKLLSIYGKMFGLSKFVKPSMKSVAKFANCRLRVIDNPNEKLFVTECISQELDVIVSYSAPCVFKTQLLNAPKFGCINLHCSLLPKYAGSLPSFWSLNDGANEVGASVHIMDNKIDNGPLLKQVKTECPPDATIYENIQLTKKLGGVATLDVLKMIYENRVVEKLDSIPPRFHYGWPTISEIKSFRKNGGRLI